MSRDLLLTLLLGDGRYPTGSHAHSGALEAAVAEGRVRSLGDVRAFLAGRLGTAGVVDAWVAAAVATGADPTAAEAEYESRVVSPALRAAARAQGRGLRRTAGRYWSEVATTPVETHPVVVGVVARHAGLPAAHAAALAVHGMVMAPAAAAARLLPIDMADLVAVVADLSGLAEAVVGEALQSAGAPLACGPAWCSASTEILAQTHAHKEARLFAS